MNTTAWRIIQLVMSLPPGEQEAVRSFLTRKETAPRGEPAPDKPFGAWEAEEGLPDEDPFFKIMEEVERERHTHLPRPVPDSD